MRELWLEELDRIVLFLNTAEEKQARFRGIHRAQSLRFCDRRETEKIRRRRGRKKSS